MAQSHPPRAADTATAAPPLAPCVAIVGPPNSGKTTLLHLLDHALQLHPDRPLVYVVKGNPDGTGRYLFHAPHLREALKPHVKGAWTPVTAETIAGWIERCRRRLDLVVLDVGGKHSESNDLLFHHCTHFLVLARRLEDEAAEREEGMSSWMEAGRAAGLRPVARVRSLWQEGEPRFAGAADGVLEAAFRADATAPADSTNQVVVTRLAEILLSLCTRRPEPAYLDLRLARDWTFDDLPHLAGLLPDLRRRAEQGEVILGGRAPIWAYAAALHRALDANSRAAVEVFDPKTPSGLVPVPETLRGEPTPETREILSARWAQALDLGGTVLELEIRAPDRFLLADFTDHLHALPIPAGDLRPGPVVISGAGPIWLHLAYSRWLRSAPGERRIGHADMRTGHAVFVAGPETPATHRWEPR